MSFSKLFENFRDRELLPIEISEIADAICNLGFQDEITFKPVPMDTADLCGVIYQYKDHTAVYGTARLVTIIAHPENAAVEDSRVICCKELLHVVDRAFEKINSRQRLDEVVKNLTERDKSGPAMSQLIALQDKMTLYRCISLLFPPAARKVAKSMHADGSRSYEQIAAWAAMPLDLVKFALREEWDEFERTYCAEA
jgi:hypothetical protein